VLTIGLSKGAKVGIAVGVIILVVAAVVGIYVFVKRRKSKKLDPRYSYNLDPTREPVSGRLGLKEDRLEDTIPVNTPIRYPEDYNELPGGRTQNY
jgi:hypothetical protein